MNVAELQLHSKSHELTPSLNMPHVGNGSRFQGYRRLSRSLLYMTNLSVFSPETCSHSQNDKRQMFWIYRPMLIHRVIFFWLAFLYSLSLLDLIRKDNKGVIHDALVCHGRGAKTTVAYFTSSQSWTPEQITIFLPLKLPSLFVYMY